MYIAYVFEFAFSIKASYAFLLLELGLGKSKCMGYFMEDQVKENFRYVLSIRMLNETLQDKTVV